MGRPEHNDEYASRENLFDLEGRTTGNRFDSVNSRAQRDQLARLFMSDEAVDFPWKHIRLN